MWCSSCLQCVTCTHCKVVFVQNAWKLAAWTSLCITVCPQDQNAVCTWLLRWNTIANAGLIGATLSTEALT